MSIKFKIKFPHHQSKQEPVVSRVATQDLFRARDANTSMIKIVQTSQVKLKYHVGTRDLEHTAKIPTKPMPCGKKTFVERLQVTEKKGQKERK